LGGLSKTKEDEMKNLQIRIYDKKNHRMLYSSECPQKGRDEYIPFGFFLECMAGQSNRWNKDQFDEMIRIGIDKAGNNVYDGDIIKVDSDNELWLILWRDESKAFCRRTLQEPATTPHFFGLGNLNRYRVVGHIHEANTAIFAFGTKPNEAMHYAGYIAPDGKLYSCPSEAHVWLAKALVLRSNYVVPSDSAADRVLCNEGWLKVQRDGLVHIREMPAITQKQLDTLGDLLICEHHTAPPPVIKDSPYVGDIYRNGSSEDWTHCISQTINYYTIGSGRIK
jgi:hypothetical protein